MGDDDNRPMNRITGGDLPAEVWRRFMLAAEANRPLRDFAFAPGATPPPAPPSDAPAAASGGRESFYQGLARDFAEAAHDESPR